MECTSDHFCQCGIFRSSKAPCQTDKDCEKSCKLNWPLILGTSGTALVVLVLLIWGTREQLKANKEADELTALIRRFL